MLSKHLFLDVYNEYLLYAKKKQKEQSFTTTKYKLNSHILPFFEKMYLEDITSKNILEWEDYILSKNFSNNQNRSIYYILSAFLEYCHVFYNFDKTIISNIGCFKKKYEKDNHDFYNLKEFKKFIKCVDNEVYKQFFNFMFFTGTRPGEALALTFNDIDNDYVTISKTINSRGKRNIGTPKTNSSNRKIKIDKKLKKDLLRLKKMYEEKYPNEKDLFVFGGINPLATTTINRYKEKACKKANIRPITLHQFRHSHATFLLQKGIMVNEVSKRLGHSRASVTLDVYSHTDLTQEKRVINTLNSTRFSFGFSLSTLTIKIKSILKR